MSLPISVKNAKIEQFYIGERLHLPFLGEIGMTQRREPFPPSFRNFVAYDYLSDKETIQSLPYSFSICLGEKKSGKTHITLFIQDTIKDKKIKEAQDALINKLKGYQRVEADPS